jgi:hypothetical protein
VELLNTALPRVLCLASTSSSCSQSLEMLARFAIRHVAHLLGPGTGLPHLSGEPDAVSARPDVGQMPWSVSVRLTGHADGHRSGPN